MQITLATLRIDKAELIFVIRKPLLRQIVTTGLCILINVLGEQDDIFGKELSPFSLSSASGKQRQVVEIGHTLSVENVVKTSIDEFEAILVAEELSLIVRSYGIYIVLPNCEYEDRNSGSLAIRRLAINSLGRSVAPKSFYWYPRFRTSETNLLCVSPPNIEMPKADMLQRKVLI